MHLLKTIVPTLPNKKCLKNVKNETTNESLIK